MQTDLDLLIAALEAEQKTLKRQIKEYAAEADYLLAHYHSQALMELNSRLRNLYLFKDPLYAERKHWEDAVSRLKKMQPQYVKDKNMWKRRKARMSQRFANELAQIKEKEKYINHFFIDGQEIDDALFDLYKEKCNAFKLINADDQIGLIFSIKENWLIIELELKTEYDFEPDFSVNSKVYNIFKGTGLNYSSKNNNWFYRYDMTDFKDAWPIKVFLSHLIFDVFWAYDIKEPAKLIYL
jgi:hypothetical protein